MQNQSSIDGRKYKVMLLTEKYCDLDPNKGITSGNYNLYGSLTSSGIADIEIHYFDEYWYQYHCPIDKFVLERLKTENPDCIVVNYYPFEHDHRNISESTFGEIKTKGIPLVFTWFDSVHPHIQQLAVRLSHYGKVNVVIDVWQKLNDRFLPLWVPQDHNIFYKDDRSRDIEVCFIGSTHGYHERAHYLNFLRHNNVPLTVSGGQREHHLSIEQYAEILRRSKISLNFPTKPDGCEQAKARIYETMFCGALLFERENSCIQRWFVPGEDYVPFYNENDLLAKIHHYLNNEKERKIIAENGCKKCMECYNSKNWWTTVIESAVK